MTKANFVVAHFYFMQRYKNYSLENIVEKINGIWYVEEWRPIPNYEKRYQISSFGRIKILNKVNKCNGLVRPERIKKICLCGRYLRVSFLRIKTISVHRLVGIVFIPNPLNKPQINHLDLDSWNNHISNLEWVTQSENNKHAVENNKCWQAGLKHLTFSDRLFIKDNYFKVDREVLMSKFKISSTQVYRIGTNRDTKFKDSIKILGTNLRKKKAYCEPVFKPIIDLNTGIFYTSAELADILNIKKRYVNRLLNEDRKPNTTQYRYA